MDDAALMECVEGAQDRQGDSGRLGQGDGPLASRMLSGSPSSSSIAMKTRSPISCTS